MLQSFDEACGIVLWYELFLALSHVL